MLNWKNFVTPPDEQNLKTYPTIVDIVEDIMQDYMVSNPVYPLPGSDSVFNPCGRFKYQVVRCDTDPTRVTLYPSGRNMGVFYRGERKDYGSCKASFSRLSGSQEILLARLRMCEFKLLLHRHPIINFVENADFQIKTPEYNAKLFVDYDALAQHYGICTPFLDVTSDILVAAFFAVAKYCPESDNWQISESEEYGILYRCKYDDMIKLGVSITPVGKQYFNRPGRQSAFVLDMGCMDDFTQFDPVEKIYFRHDENADSLILDICQQGHAYFPKDSLGEAANVVRNQMSFSKEAVANCKNKYYGLESMDDFAVRLNNSNIGIIEQPVVEWNKTQINEEWKYWHKEGAIRFLSNLQVLPILMYQKKKE